MEHSSETSCLKESPLSADSGCETSPPGVIFLEEANNAGEERIVSVLDSPANSHSSGANPCQEDATCLHSSVSRTSPPCTEQLKEPRHEENTAGSINPSYCLAAENAALDNEFLPSYDAYSYPLSYSYIPNDYAFYYTGQHSPDEFPCYSGSIIANTQPINSTFESPSPLLYSRTDDASLNDYLQWAELQQLNIAGSSADVPRYPLYACTYPSAGANSYAFDYYNMTPNADMPHGSLRAPENSSSSEVQRNPFLVDPSLTRNSLRNFSDNYEYYNRKKQSSSRDRPQISVTDSKALVHVQRRYSVPNHRVYSRSLQSPPPLDLRLRFPSDSQRHTASQNPETGGRTRNYASRRHSAPPDHFWPEGSLFSNDRRQASAIHGRLSSIASLDTRRENSDFNVSCRERSGDKSANRNARRIQSTNTLTSPKLCTPRVKGVMKQYNFYQRLDLPHDCLGKPHLLSTDPRSPRSVEVLWRDHIALLFRNLRETWLISRAPDDFHPTNSWLVSKDLAKVRFYCRRCCDGWTSMYGVVVFYYRRNKLVSRSRSSHQSVDEVQPTAEYRPNRNHEREASYSGCSYSRNQHHLDDVETEVFAYHENSLNRATKPSCVDELGFASGLNLEKNVDSDRFGAHDVNNNFVEVENDRHYSNNTSDHFVAGVDSELGSMLTHEEPLEVSSGCNRKHDGVRGWGEVLYEVAGQKCSRCSPQIFEMPLWYADEAQKVITNLYYAVARRLYGLCTPSPIRTRRLGQPSFHHNAGLCQGCTMGLCKAELCSTRVTASVRSHLPGTQPPSGHAEFMRSTGTYHEALRDYNHHKDVTNRLSCDSEGNGFSCASRERCSSALHRPNSHNSEFQARGDVNRRQPTGRRNDFGSYIDQTSIHEQNGLDWTPYMTLFPERKHRYPQNDLSTNLLSGNTAPGSRLVETLSTGNEIMNVDKLASSYSSMAVAQVDDSPNNTASGQSSCYQSLSLTGVDSNAYRAVTPYSLITTEQSHSPETFRATHPMHFLPPLYPLNFPTLLATQTDVAHDSTSLAGQQSHSSHVEQPLLQGASLSPPDARNSYQCVDTSTAAQGESILVPCPSFAPVPFLPGSLGTYHY